jgi:hypothetical protein
MGYQDVECIRQPELMNKVWGPIEQIQKIDWWSLNEKYICIFLRMFISQDNLSGWLY